MNNDLDWYYETLTESTAIEDKAMFENAGIDLREKYKLINPGDQLFILDKKPYKNGILIYSKGISPEGTIYTGPNIFVIENNLWKETFEYAGDQELLDYLDFAAPEDILCADIRFFPNCWKQSRPQQLPDKKPTQHFSTLRKVSVLCVLGNLRDHNGNIQGVEDIDPETLVLNYMTKPIPWQIGPENLTAVLINNKKKNPLAHKFSKNLAKDPQLRKGLDGPVMLVRFSLLEAINSMDNATLF